MLQGPVSNDVRAWTPWQWLLFGSILLLAFAAGGRRFGLGFLAAMAAPTVVFGLALTAAIAVS